MSDETGARGDNPDCEILDRLQQYGESWLDDDSYNKYVKKMKSSSRNSSTLTTESRGIGNKNSFSTPSRRQKKKLKHKAKQEDGANKIDSESESVTENSNSKQRTKANRKRKLEKLKSELGLLPADSNSSLKTTEIVESDVDCVSGHSQNSKAAKVVVFEDPAKRKRRLHKVKPTTTTTLVGVSEKPGVPPDTRPLMNLRDARYDVKTFGIKGFQGEQKETAVQDLLMKLGAKPPKKSFHNYKDYMEIRKQQISDQKDRREMGRQMGFKVSSGDKKRRRRKGDIGYLDGQIGSYRSGVQVLKRNDIKRVKMSKVKK